MDIREIYDQTTTGDRLSVVGALVLLGSLAMAWYHVNLSDPQLGLDPRVVSFFEKATKIGPFDALAYLDWVFLGVGVAVIVVVVGMAVGAIDESFRKLMESAGSVTALTIIYRMVDRPGPRSLVALDTGIWVALIGAVLISAGGMVNRRRQEYSLSMS